MAEWHVGLSPWIIQDGNYGDFHRGEVADFALEYFPHSLTLSSRHEARAERVDGCRYRVDAKVVHSEPALTVLDFGIRAYCQGHNPHGALTWLEADIYLGIDHYSYFEQLNKNPQVPALIYAWRIERILRESAPYIEGLARDGRKALVWDESRKASEEVDRTDAWGDERKMRPTPTSLPASGFHYTLVCTILEEPPGRSRRFRT